MLMNCPICRSDNTAFRFTVKDRIFRTTPDTFEIHRCRHCGCRFLHPMPESRKIFRYYPAHYWGDIAHHGGNPLSSLTEHYRKAALYSHVKRVRAIWKKQTKKGIFVRLLDVGCGDGSFLAACDISPCLGLDRSKTAVRHAARRGIAALQGSLPLTRFRDRTFSIITLFHFLEHTASFASHLREAHRLLAPGGSLVVQVPNADSLQARILKDKWMGYDPPRHLVHFSPATLRRALENSGFTIEKQYFFSLRDNAPMLAGSIAPALYPPAANAEKVRGPMRPWLNLLAFLALVCLSFPFTTAESLAGRGGTVTVHAKPARRPPL